MTLGKGLSEADREMLIHLAQEASEVAQAATKLLLFGREATNPHSGEEYNNVDHLSMEVGNLHFMVEECHKRDLIAPVAVAHGIARKKERLPKYRMTIDEG